MQAEGTQPPAASADVIERSIPVQEDLLGRLREVEVPGDVREDYTAFLDRIESSLPLFDDLAEAVRRNREDPELTTEFAQIAADTRPFANEHGLTECLPDAAGAAG